MNIYWGDLHAHCAASYGNGTPQQALNNAKEHLDFCSITGHAFWPDMPMDLEKQNKIIGMHLGGFAKLQYYWKDMLKQLKDANKPGEFVTLPSYEWHSMEFGDYNCYFKNNNVNLIDGKDLKTLAKNLKKQNKDFFMIPHHCGYVKNFRGTNWDAFNPEHSPVVEIYSNHGCAESDDAPYEYHHSMGPRVGESMVRQALMKGFKFGFIASTDNHDGYPGHYSHGRVGVIANKLDRNSIWKAIKQRRTIASTGAKIKANVELGGSGIGQITKQKDQMPLLINVESTAPLSKVELIEASGQNWQIRQLPTPCLSNKFMPGIYKIKIESGWGRGDNRSDWDINAAIKNGKLLGIEPCFRYSGYKIDEQQIHNKITAFNKNKAQWQCQAIPNPAGIMGGTHFNAGGTQSVVLEVEADKSTTLKVVANKVEFNLKISELVKGSCGQQIEGFGSAAIKIHQATAQREFSFDYNELYTPIAKKPGFIYLRVTQTDNQTAWISPIWFE